MRKPISKDRLLRHGYNAIEYVLPVSLAGFCLGLLLLQFLLQFIAHNGTSPVVMSSLVMASAFGVSIGQIVARSFCSYKEHWVRLGGWMTLVVWGVLSPWIMQGLMTVPSLFTLETLSFGFVRFAISFLIAFGLLIVPLMAVVIISRQQSQLATSAKSSIVYWTAGIAFGLWGGAAFLGPIWGGDVLRFLAISGCTLPGVLPSFTRFRHSAGSNEAASLNDDFIRVFDWKGKLGLLVGLFAVGVLTFATRRLLAQLMIETIPQLMADVAGLLLGVVIGYRLLRGNCTTEKKTAIAGWSLFGAAIAFCVLLIGYESLIGITLTVNANVSLVTWQILCRSALPMLVLLPSGAALGTLLGLLNPRQPGDIEASQNQRILHWFAFPLFALGLTLPGFLVSATILLEAFFLAGVIMALIAALSLLALNWPSIRFAWQARKLTMAVTTAGMLFIVVTPFLQTFSRKLPSRLLFSTQVFVAARLDVDSEWLTALDESRFERAIDSSVGTLTFWRRNGVQRQVKLNGVPVGSVSASPEICPAPASEMLPALIPLALHKAPRNVLLIGLSGGVGLKCTTAFPTQSITCVVESPRHFDVIADQLWQDADENPLRDSRVVSRVAPLSWATRNHDNQFDVIISQPGLPGIAGTSSCLTQEFYANVAAQLNKSGLFCQRVDLTDFGPKPLVNLLNTSRSVFQHVAAIEPVPGQVLLLATNSERGLCRGDLTSRLQSPQVRSQLAQIGWDWCVPLNLPLYGPKLLEQQPANGSIFTNTCGNLYLAYQLPGEMLRWGAKSGERTEVLGPHAESLLVWLGEEGNRPEILQRIGEVAGQQKLLTEYPDQYWVYRKSVREQLTDHPRTLMRKNRIRQVGLGTDAPYIHPDDRRRMDYFTALSKVTKSRRADLNAINTLSEFSHPYDPLVSYFLHEEAAASLRRMRVRALEDEISEIDDSSLNTATMETEDDQVALASSQTDEGDHPAVTVQQQARRELWHRLHTAYFSSPQSRSVRNLINAIHLLCNDDLTDVSRLDRWDHLNAMLQLLQTRWRNRGPSRTAPSRVVLNDIEKSIAAVEAAFRKMEQLAQQEPPLTRHWAVRHHYLKQTLLRPLDSYRERLLPHYMGGAADTRKMIKSALDEAEKQAAELDNLESGKTD